MSWPARLEHKHRGVALEPTDAKRRIAVILNVITFGTTRSLTSSKPSVRLQTVGGGVGVGVRRGGVGVGVRRGGVGVGWARCRYGDEPVVLRR